ncbi:hypothetical protein E2C01_091931 [Portunus trituberculatus]|uniref:Uncharacterized protein n=1 Tax=Portunus trituberculatus TaxID=210409 RepID=A0A5B7JIU9_PORTR|nr:hypothetical protein [Portunus trituberculatus]
MAREHLRGTSDAGHPLSGTTRRRFLLGLFMGNYWSGLGWWRRDWGVAAVAMAGRLTAGR